MATERLRACLVAALVVCGGCTEERETQGAPVESEDGARLQAQTFALGDLVVFSHWFDRDRGEACAMSSAPEPDGSRHCLPTERLEFERGLHNLFADASCTEPMFSLGESGLVEVALERPTNTCAEAPRVFELSPPSYHAIRYAFDTDGNCFGADAELEFRQLAAEIPLGQFVRASESVEPVGEGIGRTWLVADDGARELVGARDLDLGDRVEARTVNGERMFAPTQVAFDFGAAGTLGPGLYADPGCTRSVAGKIADSAICPITTVLQFGAFEGCLGFPETFAHVSAEVEPASIFSLADDGACVSFPQPEQGTLYVEGTAERTLRTAGARNLGQGRIRRRWDVTSSGALVLPTPHTGRFVDLDWAQPCDVGLAADGVERCLPTTAGGVIGFVDASCTEPLFELGRNAACEVWPEPPALILSPADRTAYAVGRQQRLETFYRPVEGVCTEVQAGDPTLYRLFTLTEIAPSALAKVR